MMHDVVDTYPRTWKSGSKFSQTESEDPLDGRGGKEAKDHSLCTTIS
jgi:hypothetical protein